MVRPAATLLLSFGLLCGCAHASWLNTTLLATKLNATDKSASSAAAKLQSAVGAAKAADKLADSYALNKRTKAYDLKNATSASALAQYTVDRLEFESRLKQGSAFSTVTTLPASSGSAAASDITCYFNPQDGTVLNVVQGAASACSAGGTPVVIPTAGAYVTRIEMAIDKELPFVGRLNFFVQKSLADKPTMYTCGFAGGDAISLFPKGNVVASFSIGCQPLGASTGRRRLAAASTAVNPELVTAVVASSSVVAGAGTPVAPAVAPTGVVKAPSFSPPADALSPTTLARLEAASNLPSPLSAEVKVASPPPPPPPSAPQEATQIATQSVFAAGPTVFSWQEDSVGFPPAEFKIVCVAASGTCSSSPVGSSAWVPSGTKTATITNLDLTNPIDCYVVARNPTAEVCSSGSMPLTQASAGDFSEPGQYYDPTDSTVVQCPANYYCPGGLPLVAVKTPCAQGKTSPTGSSTMAACV